MHVRKKQRYKQFTPTSTPPASLPKKMRRKKRIMRQVERMDLWNSVILDLQNAFYSMLPFLGKFLQLLCRSVRKWWDREKEFIYVCDFWYWTHFHKSLVKNLWALYTAHTHMQYILYNGICTVKSIWSQFLILRHTLLRIEFPWFHFAASHNVHGVDVNGVILPAPATL